MENFKRYRAFYIDDNNQLRYINNGKFYKTLAACKCGVRMCARLYDVPIGSTIKYTIEEYAMTLTENTKHVNVKRVSEYRNEVRYEEN